MGKDELIAAGFLWRGRGVMKVELVPGDQGTTCELLICLFFFSLKNDCCGI